MSLVPKIDEIGYFVLDKNPDLVLIYNRNMLKNRIDRNEVNIPEYKMVYKNRVTGSHGGVCLFIKDSFSSMS